MTQAELWPNGSYQGEFCSEITGGNMTPREKRLIEHAEALLAIMQEQAKIQRKLLNALETLQKQVNK